MWWYQCAFSAGERLSVHKPHERMAKFGCEKRLFWKGRRRNLMRQEKKPQKTKTWEQTHRKGAKRIKNPCCKKHNPSLKWLCIIFLSDNISVCFLAQKLGDFSRKWQRVTFKIAFNSSLAKNGRVLRIKCRAQKSLKQKINWSCDTNHDWRENTSQKEVFFSKQVLQIIKSVNKFLCCFAKISDRKIWSFFAC